MKQLCLCDLVEELRHFRSSRGSSMIPDLALKGDELSPSPSFRKRGPI